MRCNSLKHKTGTTGYEPDFQVKSELKLSIASSDRRSDLLQIMAEETRG